MGPFPPGFASGVGWSIRVAVLFILPSFASLEREVPLKIRIALNRLPLFPGKPEVEVLELVVEADLGRVGKARAEIQLVDARPVNGAHAHRAGGAVRVELAALEHLRPLGHHIGRAFGPGNQLEISLVVIRAQQGLGVNAAAGINDGGYFGVTATIIVLMWNDTARTLVNGALRWFGVSAGPNDIAHFDIWLVREVMWWSVVVVLTAFLFRLLWSSRAAQDMVGLLAGRPG